MSARDEPANFEDSFEASPNGYHRQLPERLVLIRSAMRAGGWHTCAACEGRGVVRAIQPFPVRDSGVIWNDTECPECVLGMVPGEGAVQTVARHRWASQGLAWEELEAEERAGSRNRVRRDLITARRAEVRFAEMELEFEEQERNTVRPGEWELVEEETP